MNITRKVLVGASITAIAFAFYHLGHSDGRTGVKSFVGHALGFKELSIVSNAHASQESEADASPSTGAAVSDREVYYPGSEALAPDEMRIVACGTGMPNARPKQAAACFLVELGNGDKFLFDIGTGSSERISALMIPYDYLDKVFIGHLHADHFGDLDALWIGGVLANRQRPLRVWGPSGSEKRLGIKHACDHMEEMYAWDYASRQGNVNTVGFRIEAEEFDYRAVNQVVYEENGVQIRTIPAIHALDGPVSFILEWNGLKFTFSSDTFPNKWWMEHAAGSDLAIHECFIAPKDLVNLQNWAVGDALNLGTQVHASPAQFGKVMSEIKPRMAVVEEAVWPLPSITETLPADPNDRVGFSEFITSGRVRTRMSWQRSTKT